VAFQPITKEELLEVWRRIFPPSYTVPIEEESAGQGFDMPSTQAEQLAAAASIVNTITQAYYLKPHSIQTALPAGGAEKSIGMVTLTRAPPLAGDYELDAGTQLLAVQEGTRGERIEGVLFNLLSALTLPAGSTVPVDAPIIAERAGYQGNVRAGTISAFALRGRASVAADVIADNSVMDDGTPDRFTLGMVGQFIRFPSGANVGTFPRKITVVTEEAETTTVIVDGPPLLLETGAQVEVLEFADLRISVTQPEPTMSGCQAFLDAIGSDRNAGRAVGESDESYRERLCALDDTISPAAILRIAGRILSPLGIGYVLKETRDPNGLRGFVWDLDPFDFGDLSNGQVLLDSECGAVRFFILCVGNGNQGEFGAPYDSPFPDNAWDVLAFDGFAAEYRAALGALYDAVEAARAAGICWELVLDTTL